MILFAIVTPAQTKRCSEAGSIRRVAKSAAGNFETVTFDVLIKKPDYTVSTDKPPFQEYGSEKRLRIAGPYYKSIVFRGINWECTIGESFGAKTSNIKAVKSIEQFEGQVEYVIGYRSHSSYMGVTATSIPRGRRITIKFRK